MTLQFRFKTKKLIEDKKTNQVAIDTVKKWLQQSQSPNLPEEFISLFLLSCYNNIDVAKETIMTYLKIKNSAPRIYNDFDCEELKTTLGVLGVAIMPKRLGNTVVIVCKLLDTNYKSCEAFSLLKLSTVILHWCQLYDPPDDFILVADVAGLGFMHLTRIKMGPCFTHIRYVQEGLPLRFRSIHILNSNYVFDKGLSFFKMMIKSEIFQSIKTHPAGFDVTKFNQECVPKSCLPREYGGELPPLRELIKTTWEKPEEILEFLREEQKLRSGVINQ